MHEDLVTPPSPPGTRYGMVLWTLTPLFCCRVTGQILVAWAGVPWLPPMPEWYSGLLPYPVLLPIQLLMIAGMAHLNLGVHRGDGPLSTRRPRLGGALVAFAGIYALAMAVRYGVFHAWYPERGYFPPGSIPIMFHFVLAGYVFTLGRYTLVHGRRPA